MLEDIVELTKTAIISGYEWAEDDDFPLFFELFGFGTFSGKGCLCYNTVEGWVPIKDKEILKKIQYLEDTYEDDGYDVLEDIGISYCSKINLSLKSKILRWTRYRKEYLNYCKVKLDKETILKELDKAEEWCCEQIVKTGLGEYWI